MTDTSLDVVVIGAGQAGLGISYYLQQFGLSHLVFERARIGETWRTQRWDSFALNSPNKLNMLPGDTYTGARPEGYDSAPAFVYYLVGYARRFELPVLEQARVLLVERNSSRFHVTATVQGKIRGYTCRQVVVASGGMNEQLIPPLAKNISPSIKQYHAGEYRSPAQLPEGAVLVVGSAQSGLQVAEDIVDAGKNVFLSTSAVGRVPRRYRGIDILEWLLKVGFYEVKTDHVTDPRELELKPPQVSGVGPNGRTHSLQSLAKKGVVILGKVRGPKPEARGSRSEVIELEPNAAEHVKFSDDISARLKGLIEQYITKNHLDLPPPEHDPADEPDVHASCASPLRELDLAKENIRSIVWTTGFTGDFSYLKGHPFDKFGHPSHHNGISDLPGVYVIGLPWLRKRKSGIVCGISEDAKFVAERMKASLGR
jgi:putative flavoprotein involved in K+ transport